MTNLSLRLTRSSISFISFPPDTPTGRPQWCNPKRIHTNYWRKCVHISITSICHAWLCVCASVRACECGCVCIVPVAHKEPMVNTIWIVEVVGSCGWMGSNQCVGMRKQQYLMPLIFYYYYSSLPGKDAEQCETKLILCVSALLPGYRTHGIQCKHNNRQWTRQRKRERGGDRNIVS